MNTKQVWQMAPNDEVDSTLQPLIALWDDEPTSIQLLEILDRAVNEVKASFFAISTLNVIYMLTLEAEGKTHEQVVEQASWRKDDLRPLH